MSLFSSDPYSAFAIYAEYASYQNRVLVWSSTDLNIASNNATHYNTSSGKYCPHHRGTYLFQLHMYKKPIATGSPICSIVKELPSGDLSNLAEARTSSGSLGGSTATIVDLEQGDCVWAGSCGGSLDDISFKTAFSGALLNLLD